MFIRLCQPIDQDVWYERYLGMICLVVFVWMVGCQQISQNPVNCVPKNNMEEEEEIRKKKLKKKKRLKRDHHRLVVTVLYVQYGSTYQMAMD